MMVNLVVIAIGLGIMSVLSAMVVGMFTMAWTTFEETELWEIIKKHFGGKEE